MKAQVTFKTDKMLLCVSQGDQRLGLLQLFTIIILKFKQSVPFHFHQPQPHRAVSNSVVCNEAHSRGTPFITSFP